MSLRCLVTDAYCLLKHLRRQEVNLSANSAFITVYVQMAACFYDTFMTFPQVEGRNENHLLIKNE